MKSFVIKMNMILIYLVLFIPIRIIFKIKRRGLLLLERDKNYIVVANHLSKADPFLILASLSFSEFLTLAPIRFVTSDEYLSKWYYRALLLPLGCISTKPRNGQDVLMILKERLVEGETIFIFPMGGYRKKFKKPKVGAVYLEKEVKGAYLLPVKIRLSTPIEFSTLFKRLLRTTIVFRQPYKHTEFTKDLQPLADELMKRISN